MKKQKNLVLRLSLLTISIFILLFAVFSITTNVLVYRNSVEQSEINIQAKTETASKEIQQVFEKTISLLKTEKDSIASLYNQGELNTAQVVNLQQQVLSTNENILGLSIILDPSKLQETSENETNYINNSNHFAPYTYRDTNKIDNMPIDDTAQAEWYTKPKELKKTYITEPYDYDLNGDIVSLVSVTVPIIINDEFFGVALADFTLNFLDEIVAKNVPDTALQRVISPAGIVISDSSGMESKHQQMSNYVTEWDKHSQSLQSGEKVSYYAKSDIFNEETFTLLTPLQIDENIGKWIIETSIPKSSILSTFNSVIKISVVAAILMAIILAALTYYFISKNLKPLQSVKFALEEAAAGKLTVEVEKNRLKNDEIGAVGNAYNYMREQMYTVVQNVSNASDLILDQSEKMNRSVEEMSQSSEEISRAIEEIAKGAQVQSEEIDQSNSQMSALGEKIDILSKLSNEVLISIQESNNQAKMGMDEVENLRQQTSEVTTVNNELDIQMGNLEEKLQSINKVMVSIQNITAQTNLLALNASIEAARAGEHGKGFAVVAEEVRKLAEQSQHETEEVQKTVSSILQQAEQTSQIVQKSNVLVSHQKESVSRTELAFKQQLTAATHIESRINQFIERLNVMLQEKENTMLGMQQIVAISEQSAASAEEVTAGAAEQYNEMEKVAIMMNELKDLAHELKITTQKFTL
ncbi:methyl-accepting chemotaxis protein [Lysinibacillus antri]|uniref:Methyl-accepting chemotaxis protein n=1 Tax=Lysinibacillus antri TaxID=2498145 RepID=A0A3S0RX34_9BACI|nr:methyl-accepting chemotaxis protein [Lysinibacillus antri]RUL55499.1 methyl-accepting chemotaxis protein [Lysinibacillus antri]